MTLLLATLSPLALAHGPVEFGPNKGRIVEFSENESMHGEITIEEGKFHIALLDKDMKPVKIENQTLSATGGTRAKPEKLDVETKEDVFVVPLIKDGQWLILQYKETPEAKPVTARILYDAEKFLKPHVH
jgi:hypothetical protein